IEDAEPTVILTIDDHIALAREIAGPNIAALSIDPLLVEEAIAIPTIDLSPDDTAFLVYTSGSTGRPKAVIQTHGQILRDAIDVARAAAIMPEDRVLLLASLWGVQALNTSWITLFGGATLMSYHVAEYGLTGLSDWLIEQRISVFVSASSLFRHFI